MRGSLNITHMVLLAVIILPQRRDNHKQTIHDVKLNINNTTVINYINMNFFCVNLFIVLVKFSLHKKLLL